MFISSKDKENYRKRCMVRFEQMFLHLDIKKLIL